MKPKRIVELGTAHGTSFFAMTQAVRDEGFQAECYAIDTWAGDAHAGQLDNQLYSAVASVATQEVPSISTLLRMTFQEALANFSDESIDLLHIDGFHTYDAVSEDYRTWLPKLAQSGVVLFHDIAVRRDDFGVYRFWDEMKSLHPYIEFDHSFGLGVLFPKGLDARFEDLVRTRDLLKLAYGFQADGFQKQVQIEQLTVQRNQYATVAEERLQLLNRMSVLMEKMTQTQ